MIVMRSDPSGVGCQLLRVGGESRLPNVDSQTNDKIDRVDGKMVRERVIVRSQAGNLGWVLEGLALLAWFDWFAPVRTG